MEATPKMERIKKRFEKRYQNMNKQQKKVLNTKIDNFLENKMEAFSKNFLARNPKIDPNNPTSAQMAQAERATVKYIENTLAPKIGKMVRQAERKAIKGKPTYVQNNIKRRREREKQERLKNKKEQQEKKAGK